MSNKRGTVQKSETSVKQTKLSKFFLSETQYPTSSIRKRPVQTQLINSPPLEKFPKIQEISASSKYGLPSPSTSKHLLSFAFAPSHANARDAFQKGINCRVPSQSIYSVEDTNQKVACEDGHLNESPSSLKYTPLEKQYLEFKKLYSNTVLLIECGYKFRFFGKDAEIASEVLNIGCFKYHNFMSASIPVARLCFHVRALVEHGLKVGVIRQTETAALKAAGNNRNDLFHRKLDALFTKSTLIGEEFLIPDSEDGSESLQSFDTDLRNSCLMCIYEQLSSDGSSNSENMFKIAIVAVNVFSGDIVYACFEDLPLRNKLENYLFHLNPAEILLPTSLNRVTENLVRSFCEERNTRIEQVEQNIFDHSTALQKVTDFYTNAFSNKSSAESYGILERILSLPDFVISCFSCLITYLTDFNLEGILKNVQNMHPMSSDYHMCLNAATLKGLNILLNSSNNMEHGSLFWVLNATSTSFGRRLLKLWVTKPLKKLDLIEERLHIVTEIIYSESIVFRTMEKILSNKLPDLERCLCSAFYQKCSCRDFYNFLQALKNIRNEVLAISDKIATEVEVERLRIILFNMVDLLEGIDRFLSNINPEAAKNDDKTKVFRDTSMFTNLQQCIERISYCEKKLDDIRPNICKTLHLLSFKYKTVSGQKFLIEVPESHLQWVPKDWLKISSTKQVCRFRSPEVTQLYNELEQQNELLQAYAREAWLLFLEFFKEEFYKFKRAISYLAEMDCYFSLAKVAKSSNYCRPKIVCNNSSLIITQGRHPVIEKEMGEERQFVANDLFMNEQSKCIIVTGPNMGGKSTYVRQTALISIMAQIGSYVPAASATMPLFDNVHVRMGADDDIVKRRSSFMTEMSETSEILSNSTTDTFVIFDELGRGTSTNDGAAIAYATLEYLLREIKCFTLFVTHYPTIINLRDIYPSNISAVHMNYILNNTTDTEDIERVTFLFNAVRGTSKKSYGINVAALAGVPTPLLQEAEHISKVLELKDSIKMKLKLLMNLRHEELKKME